jgi:hypothetical protein
VPTAALTWLLLLCLCLSLFSSCHRYELDNKALGFMKVKELIT